MPRRSDPATAVPRLPYVVTRRGRGGDSRVYTYFRTRRAGRETLTALRGEPGSAEWHAHYAECKALLKAAPRVTRPSAGTVAALIEGYKGSPEYTRLAAKTRRDYARALDRLGAVLGAFPAAAIKRAHVMSLRNRIVDQSGPRAADLWVSVVSRAWGVAIDLGLAEINPAERIGDLARNERHPAWPAHVRAAFEASCPPRHLMTAYLIGLWTGLRAGDIVRLGRQHDDGVILNMRTGKTARSTRVELCMPAPAPLRAHLDSLPADRLLYVTRPDGAPIDPQTLAKELRRWMTGLGHAGYTLHGLRHTAGAALAELGASEHMIQAFLTHATPQMAALYTATANRLRLATEAVALLDANENGTGRGKTQRGRGKTSGSNVG